MSNNWSNNAPASPNTTANMPTQITGSTRHDASHVNALRDWLIAMQARGFDPIWLPLPLQQPAGVSAAATLLYAFDGGASQLNDLSPSGADLTVAQGTERNAKRSSTVGLVLSGERLESAALAAFQHLGALTVEVVIHFGDISTTNDILFGAGAAGETEAANWPWLIYVEALTGKLVFFSENGAGIDDNIVTDMHVLSGAMQHLVVTRNGSTGLLTCYQNGLQISTHASTLPTGASSAYVVLGGQIGGGEEFHGSCFSAKVTPEEFTAAQVLESYEHVRGIGAIAA